MVQQDTRLRIFYYMGSSAPAPHHFMILLSPSFNYYAFGIILLINALRSFAAPVQNLTALGTEIAPAWVANPSGLGTWDLLYSCTFTIFLCVYSAIHLNVPPEEPGFRFWLRKTKWVFIAVLAPEVVVYTAFEQWILSRRFLKDLNKILDDSTNEKSKGWVRSYDLKCRFDMVYAQYAVMGGFAADIQHIHNAITERVTITTEGIIFLAKHGYFCRVKKDDIQDKSKADILAKGLVCVQVLWVAGQAIERKIAGYPITLLEVHTLVHVVCAIIMYMFWIRKPLNVKDPTMVDFGDSSDIIAFMVEKSRTTSLRNRPGFKLEDRDLKTQYGEPSIIWYKDPSKEPVQIKVDNLKDRLEISSPLESRSQDPTEKQIQISTLYSCTREDVDGVTHYYAIGKSPQNISGYVPVSNVGNVCKMVSGQASSLGYGPVSSDSRIIFQLGPYIDDLIESPTAIISLSEKDILRLNSTAEFLTKLKVSAIENLTASKGPQRERVASFLSPLYASYTCHGYLGDLLSLRALNYGGDILKDIDSETAYLVTAMAIIPAAYGCVHIGALSLIFPSLVERLLWKISCYYLVAAAGVCGILGLLVYLDEKIIWDWYLAIQAAVGGALGSSWRGHGVFGRYLLNGIVSITFGSIALVYVGVRLYIVVESFISMRHVPIGVYETPDVNIMNYIPHL